MLNEIKYEMKMLVLIDYDVSFLTVNFSAADGVIHKHSEHYYKINSDTHLHSLQMKRT